MAVPKNLKLADPEFDKPASIQMLIGSGTSLACLAVGQIHLSTTSNIYLQKSLFGWIIAGSLAQYNENDVTCHFANTIGDMDRFWEIEEGPLITHLSPEEKECEQHFVNNTTRTPEGRYIVALPFNERKAQLGSSKAIALRRFLSLERRLNKNPELKIQYAEVINEYKTLGHMSRVESDSDDGFFLPHHAVLKTSSLTTKLRVVFDGSAKSSSGLSLNDALMTGPTIQDDLFSLVLRLRLHNYVLTGDIEKMYRQVLVREEDRKYQRILWREEDGNIAVYELNTVTFGLTPAPFLAIRSIQQLCNDEGNNFPLAQKTLANDLYVDDYLTGANTIEETIVLRNEAMALLQKGGFNLRQCASNSPEVLRGLDSTHVNMKLQDHDDSTLKTLGVYWNSHKDTIVYTVKPVEISETATKRNIFSKIAQIFDPFGLLNPVITYAKLIIQDLWKLQLNWDESVPISLQTKWTEFASQLHLLNQLSFDRQITHKNTLETQLHGFCDASQKGYGACIYLRSKNQDGDVKVSLYCSKSRVAPLKNLQTIPRLELCSAQLLAKLYVSVRNAIPIEINKVVFWSDSSIALHWMKTSPHVLKTFVANRVVDIQSKTRVEDWRHVRTNDNPADSLSRGQLPQDYMYNDLWKKGPAWLWTEESSWPKFQLNATQDLPDVRNVVCLVATLDVSLFERYNLFFRLRRIVALCLRIVNPIKVKTPTRCPPLTADELRKATTRILLLTQQSSFSAELKNLRKGLPVDSKSALSSLDPGIDEEGLIRVGGRLQNSSLPYNQKHPIILPKNHRVTQLIIQQEHIRGLHTGVQATLYNLRSRYWLIDGRNQIRKKIQECVQCARLNPRPVNYKMGNLPAVRVTETRPFLNTGVDYCGPFYIKEKKFRNRNKIKTYIAIFICLVTKAVHIEVVSDMTTEAFIAALHRFIARRGICSSLHSDNITNFTGANRELKEILDLLQSADHNAQVQDHLADNGITWHFNAPYSSHLGGIWERAVRSLKHHLKAVMGNELFTFEQLNTLAIQVEAILNSRPLTPLSSDPNDLLALTPAHFLIGDSLMSLPEQDFAGTASNRLSMWQRIQQIRQEFWNRWHQEYLSELNIRHKWTSGSHMISEGSIVLIKDDNLPPLQWRLGRVIKAKPGSDGIIRIVTLKTSTGNTERSVKKLSPLPIDLSTE